MKKWFCLSIIVFSFLLTPRSLLPQGNPEATKKRIMELLQSDSPMYDSAEREEIVLANPRIIANLYLSSEESHRRFQVGLFNGLLLCCYRGVISSKEFMQTIAKKMAIGMKRSEASSDPPDLGCFAFLTSYGYVKPWEKEYVSFSENLEAFLSFLLALKQHGFFKENDHFNELFAAWQAVVNSIQKGESLSSIEAEFQRFSCILTGKKSLMRREVFQVLSAFSKNVLAHVKFGLTRRKENANDL